MTLTIIRPQGIRANDHHGTYRIDGGGPGEWPCYVAFVELELEWL